MDGSRQFEVTEERLEGGVLHVAVAGELELSTAEEVRRAIRHAMELGCDVLLDLSGVTYIDSTGLAVLVTGRKRLADQRRSLVLAIAPGSGLADKLAHTGLDRLFEITAPKLLI